MLHDPVADLLDNCYNDLPEYQFVLVDAESTEPVAIGNSIPLAWHSELDDLPDEGWDWALTKGIDDLKRGLKPDILCALQIVVFSEHRRRGFSSQTVSAMKQIGQLAGLNGMIAPVRPSQKCDYPLIPIHNYISWIDNSGRPFDSWLRVHFNLGGRIVKPCTDAMQITGTVAEWESWTGMGFPQSGQYTVPGALVPVDIDHDADSGIYVEPNVWMHHPL
jgi:hypothetical protein